MMTKDSYMFVILVDVNIAETEGIREPFVTISKIGMMTMINPIERPYMIHIK